MQLNSLEEISRSEDILLIKFTKKLKVQEIYGISQSATIVLHNNQPQLLKA